MKWEWYTSGEKMQVLWVCIGLPVLLLAAWLVRGWLDAGRSKKARRAAKALGYKTDEMEHAIITQAQAIAYRVTQTGLLACVYLRLLVWGQSAAELCILLVVSSMTEVVIMLVQTFRKAKDDEEHPPRLAFLIAKLTFCAVLIGLAVGMTVLTQNW
ncbi:MAG: hypothetical protein UEF48_02060 [Agathobaculum butyriciproducens]|jgi:hypothetical protein|nr:hypothetical protein [Agathobaculum butyriciproducens]